MKITDDVPAELIRERLTLDDCINITCPENLISVMQTIATDYVLLSPSEEDKENADMASSPEQTVRIKAMKYKM